MVDCEVTQAGDQPKSATVAEIFGARRFVWVQSAVESLTKYTAMRDGGATERVRFVTKRRTRRGW